MRNDFSLDIIETDLRLENGDATVNVEDLHDEGRLVIIHLKLQLRVTVGWAEAFSWARLTMLIALVADNVRVVNSVKVLSSDDADVKVAHWSLDKVTMNLFSTIKFLFSLLQSLIVGQDALLNLLFTLNKLVLGHDILLRELIQIDTAIRIII